MAHTNNPNYFPKLIFDKLQAYANKWAEYFTFMERIVLYDPPVEFDGDYIPKNVNYNTKYILYFKISNNPPNGCTDEERRLFPGMLKQFSESLRKDLFMTLGMGEKHFADVYIKKPVKDFSKEWAFVTKYPKGVDENFSWVLFSKDNLEDIKKKFTTKDKKAKAKQDPEDFSPEVIDLIKKARPEIELIYDAVKEGEGFSEYSDASDEARKEDALNYYQERSGKFKYLNESILEDMKIYHITNTQTKRYIIGCILQALLEKKGFNSYTENYQKLYEIYKKIK